MVQIAINVKEKKPMMFQVQIRAPVVALEVTLAVPLAVAREKVAQKLLALIRY